MRAFDKLSGTSYITYCLYNNLVERGGSEEEIAEAWRACIEEHEHFGSKCEVCSYWDTAHPRGREAVEVVTGRFRTSEPIRNWKLCEECAKKLKAKDSARPGHAWHCCCSFCISEK